MTMLDAAVEILGEILLALLEPLFDKLTHMCRRKARERRKRTSE